MQPLLVTLASSAAAALVGPLGVLPLLGRERPPASWLAWANAAAAGVMLGTAYELTAARASDAILPVILGALLGVLFTLTTQRAAGPSSLDLNRLSDTDAAYGYQVTLVAALHSSAEGMAIGAAMAVDERLGLAVATSLALHNLPEAMVLGAVLRSRGLGLLRTAAIALGANSTQVLLAVFSFALISALPSLLGWALGFAGGALVFLVTTELLPEAYREAGPLGIAVAASLSLSLVVLLAGFVP